jgi:hypothetical protein
MTDENEPITATIAADDEHVLVTFDDGFVPPEHAGDSRDVVCVRLDRHALVNAMKDDGGVTRLRIEPKDWVATIDGTEGEHDDNDPR